MTSRGIFHLFAGLTLAVSAWSAEPAPASGRITREFEGLSYTFDAGDEAFVRELAPRVAAILRDAVPGRVENRGPAPRFSPADLRANRADYLQRIAASIGLERPTELQIECYDGFLENFERTDRVFALLVAKMRQLFAVRAITIYHKEDLLRRLRAGEKIPGATLDPDGQGGRFDFSPSLNGQDDELRDLLQQRDQRRLDLGYSFSLKDGVVDLSGYTRRQGNQPAPSAPTAAQPAVPGAAGEGPLEVLPVVIAPELENLPPAAMAEGAAKFVAMFAGTPRELASAQFQNPATLAWLIFHETTELGVVERIIGSRDRRWFCEGVANYVAWKVARDTAGPELARQVYDLNAQQAQHAPWRTKIDLARWPTADRQRPAERDAPLNRAHYTFATRAVMLMVERHGEDFLPRLFAEIAGTPRALTDMRIVAKAYRRVAQEDIEQVIADALAPANGAANTPSH